MGIRNRELNILNRVRLHFKGRTLSDITDANGTHIHKEWYEIGEKMPWNKLDGPNIEEPTEGILKVWKKFLRRMCSDHKKWIRRDETK